MKQKNLNTTGLSHRQVDSKISVKRALVFAILLVSATVQAQTANQEGNSRQGKKILVAYFSWGGNTEAVAKTIHTLTGGDLFRIQTEKAYPAEYRPTTEVAKSEQKQNARPTLASRIENLDSYDTIYLGYPTWWGTLPMVLFTLLESHNFAGKTVIPFCTHEGSALGRSVDDIRKLIPQATILEGLAIRGSNARTAQNEIQNWLRKIEG